MSTGAEHSQKLRLVPQGTSSLLIVTGRDQESFAALHLQQAGFAIEQVATARDALEWLRQMPCSIVLMDSQLADSSGAELCREIRAINSESYVYLILRGDAECHGGADDYLPSSTSPEELLARLLAARRIVILEKSVRAVSETARRLKIIDHVTGVYNERHLMRELPRELERARRRHHSLALLLCGVNGTGPLEEVFRSLAGSEMLRGFVDLLVSQVRRNVDWVARLSDGLFVVVLPETDLNGACAVRLRMAEALAGCSRDVGDWTVAFGVSCGVAESAGLAPGQSSLASQLIALAVTDLKHNELADGIGTFRQQDLNLRSLSS